ncbi:hypothetical protein PE066_16055 [Ramlibacter tataouinensis]|uniref:hypothetical protein n=1 Tax=Ramlibacter tataouinensis TaxID=94132 RepID=UPI0022F3C948|nr:hypothetical protein [Ramlibacter tataouinensis]WBY00965.1 hypothetical protein PE066_16055 [Ramlibacter tataouinensis]
MKMRRDMLHRDGRPRGSKRAWRKLGLVLGLALVVGWGGWLQPHDEPPAATAAPPTATATQPAWQPGPVQAPLAAAPAGPGAPAAPRIPRYAGFRDQHPPAEVREVADWAVDSGDHGAHAFAIVDKKNARVWLFDAQGVLVQQTPALLGAAVGDDAVPGIGEKPLAEVLPGEKTTPAGRFVAEPGVNSHGEDIVWVSYDLAVSMHRVRPLVKSERRLQRLASSTPLDNRISFGCINLPVAFYEKVFAPMVHSVGAIIYVLPETRSVREQFGSYDVPRSAQRRGAATPAA